MRASSVVICALAVAGCTDLPEVGKVAPDETQPEASAMPDGAQPPVELDASPAFDDAPPSVGEAGEWDGADCGTTQDHDPALLPWLPAALGGGLDAAKAACDGEIRWTCGEFVLHIDAKGCLASVALAYFSDPLPESYERCLVGRMASHCDPCAAEQSYRVYVSCTLARAFRPSDDHGAAP